MSEERVLLSRRSFLALCGAVGATLTLPLEQVAAALPEEPTLPGTTEFPGNVRILVDDIWLTIGYLDDITVDQDSVYIDWDHIGLPRYRGVQNKTCHGTVLFSDRYLSSYGVVRELAERGESFPMEIDVHVTIPFSMVVKTRVVIERIEASVNRCWDEDQRRYVAQHHRKIGFVTTGLVTLEQR